MQNVSLQTAVKMTGKSESTIRRDVKKGKVSAGRDARGHLQFDIAELQRAYGELKTTGEDALNRAIMTGLNSNKGNGKAMTGHDSAEILAIKDNQISDLRSQLEKAETQLEIATTEKSKLLDLTDRLQKQNEVLMLPAPKPKSGWWQRLTGK